MFNSSRNQSRRRLQEKCPFLAFDIYPSPAPKQSTRRGCSRPASMQYLRDIGVNVCRSIGLEGGDQGRKTAFRGATERKSGGRLSRSTRQGEPITWRPVANFDTASFPLNRSAAAVTTTKDLEIAPGLRFFWSAPSGVAGYIPRP